MEEFNRFDGGSGALLPEEVNSASPQTGAIQNPSRLMKGNIDEQGVDAFSTRQIRQEQDAFLILRAGQQTSRVQRAKSLDEVVAVRKLAAVSKTHYVLTGKTRRAQELLNSERRIYGAQPRIAVGDKGPPAGVLRSTSIETDRPTVTELTKAPAQLLDLRPESAAVEHGGREGVVQIGS